jgi:hypothetical protein
MTDKHIETAAMKIIYPNETWQRIGLHIFRGNWDFLTDIEMHAWEIQEPEKTTLYTNYGNYAGV